MESKMKKFLPLPPLQKSQQEHSIHMQESLNDSISEAEREISSVSTSVLESISANLNTYCDGFFDFLKNISLASKIFLLEI
jgi:hypothetical protein